jgi:hypothetical protein
VTGRTRAVAVGGDLGSSVRHRLLISRLVAAAREGGSRREREDRQDDEGGLQRGAERHRRVHPDDPPHDPTDT